jgi:hypothetical protein
MADLLDFTDYSADDDSWPPSGWREKCRVCGKSAIRRACREPDMDATKSLLLAFLVAVAAIGFGGCSCPCRVPVSLEPLNDWLLYHSPACRHYPYSCPACPYTGCEHCAHAEVYSAEPTDRAPAEHMETPKATTPVKSEHKT